MLTFSMYGVSGVLTTPSRSQASPHGDMCFSFTSVTTSSMFSCTRHNTPRHHHHPSITLPSNRHLTQTVIFLHNVADLPSVLWRCWLGSRKGIRPAKTEWWGAGVVICLEQGANGPADATATPSSLAPVKFRMVHLSGAGLTRLSWEKAVKWI